MEIYIFELCSTSLSCEIIWETFDCELKLSIIELKPYCLNCASRFLRCTSSFTHEPNKWFHNLPFQLHFNCLFEPKSKTLYVKLVFFLRNCLVAVESTCWKCDCKWHNWFWYSVVFAFISFLFIISSLDFWENFK